MKIPLTRPVVLQEDIDAVSCAMRSDRLYCGPVAESFERAFATYTGIQHAIAVNSGTAALFLAIKALGRTGEVIVPSFTYVATVNAVMNTGCTPVFCDINPETFNINPELIAGKITKRTVAILPVHFAGLSCDMKPIAELCEKHDLALIEDSAEAIGALYQGRKTGSFGIGCFSFDPLKNMTTAEGGMVTTSDAVLEARVRLLRDQGMPRNRAYQKPWYRESTVPGYGMRMSEPAAALGNSQLRRLEAMNAARNECARYYRTRLNTAMLTPQPVPGGYQHTYQVFTVRVHESIDRDSLVIYLRDQGIEATVHFDPPVHQMPIIKQKVSLPVTELVSKSIMSLPMHPQLTTEEMDTVIAALESGLRTCRR